VNRKILLVGQAPSRSAGKERAFDGPSGRRLAKLAGIEFEELFERLDTVNLLARWPGKHGGKYAWREKGDRFPIARAKRAAKRISRMFGRYRVVVLCGRRVARAFAFPKYVRGIELRAPLRTNDAWVLTIPHPSGCNLLYNDRGVRTTVREFLNAAFAIASGCE